MPKFDLQAAFRPTGDQPQAIADLVKGVETGEPHQTLLGVTGSGKTFTMANVIQQTQLPTLIMAHNKTLAAQLYQEFRDFFPNNAVSYFVSYYDYYQPEAYIPSSDTYIEKEAQINDEIDKLRLAATTNLLTRNDVIVVASVSCIYNLGSPVEYAKQQMRLMEGEVISRDTLFLQLANLQYHRNDTDMKRGAYRVRGERIQVWPAYESLGLSIDTLENKITKLSRFDPTTGETVPWQSSNSEEDAGPAEFQPKYRKYTLYPAKHYTIKEESRVDAFQQIEQDLVEQVTRLKGEGKIVEAYRLESKVHHDLEQMKELGYVNGIENYSRYFDGRNPGDPPFTLLDYFQASAKEFGGGKFLTFVDESHISLPQVRGMYFGDKSRKDTLIEYGFRLPSATDNRPLQFHEFQRLLSSTVYVSATPDEFEVSLSNGQVTEQLIRPTGLLDPVVFLKPTQHQIENLVVEIVLRKQIGQRVLVTTLTKKMAEALTEYLNDEGKIRALIKSARERQQTEQANIDADKIIHADQSAAIAELPIGKIDEDFYGGAPLYTGKVPSEEELTLPKVAYLHSDVETLERSDILADLRGGIYDVVVGINLLREGLDLPEVSLVAILDADKEGFLRSRTSLIQTMGRAARHETGEVILYADFMTGSMQAAVKETQRRREIQNKHNKEHNITPTGISKPIRERMVDKVAEDRKQHDIEEKGLKIKLSKKEAIDLANIEPEALTPDQKKQLAAKLRRRMLQAAKDLDFELATLLRDTIAKLAE